MWRSQHQIIVKLYLLGTRQTKLLEWYVVSLQWCWDLIPGVYRVSLWGCLNWMSFSLPSSGCCGGAVCGEILIGSKNLMMAMKGRNMLFWY